MNLIFPVTDATDTRAIISRRAVAGLLLMFALAACGRGRDPARNELRVAAASSLRELVEETRAPFQRAFPGATLAFSFDASSSLARQIEASDAFDVFLSADAETIERVRSRLVADTIAPFLGNELVMVASEHADRAIVDPGMLVGGESRVALAGEAVPAGRYARRMLEKMGLLEALAPRIVSGDNVRATLALVESGAADFGFVYATDAAIAKQAKAVWTAGDEFDPGVIYVAAVVAGADERARDYVRWLLREEFQAAAVARGFGKPKLRIK